MNQFLIINASPRTKETSAMLAKRCEDYLHQQSKQVQRMHLYAYLRNFEQLYEAIQKADTILLCGPCYINTYPADVIGLLEKLASRKELLHGQNLYGIIQGGMPYVHTHQCGLMMLKAFANACNVTYKGGFVLGGGAMLDGKPVETLPNGRKIAKQLDIFFEMVEQGLDVPLELSEAVQLNINGWLAQLMAFYMNRTIDRDLRQRGVDRKHPNPYATGQLLQGEIMMSGKEG